MSHANDSFLSNDAREFYRVKKALTFKPKVPPSAMESDEGTAAVTAPEIARAFTQHFSRVLNSNESSPADIIGSAQRQTPFSEPEALSLPSINSVLSKVNALSAPSFDGIGYGFWKKVKQFSNVVIDSISSDVAMGLVPAQVYFMSLVPLFKKDNPSKRENYREIFLVSCLAKLVVAIALSVVYYII